MGKSMTQEMKISMNRHEGQEETSREKASRLIKEGIAKIEDSFLDVPEEDRESFEQKIKMKLKMGKPLSAKELNYLRIHNPEAYRTAMRVELSRKILKNQLKSCKTKEDVQRVVSNQLSIMRSMENDPDREYMMAMVQREIDEFKKSAAYARLPETDEKNGKAKRAREKKQPQTFCEFPVIVQSLKENELLSEQLGKFALQGGAAIDSGGARQV